MFFLTYGQKFKKFWSPTPHRKDFSYPTFEIIKIVTPKDHLFKAHSDRKHDIISYQRFLCKMHRLIAPGSFKTVFISASF
jgi:hypothetical protein